MRALLISALAAPLLGCAFLAPQQTTMNECTIMTGYACSDRTAAQTDSKAISFRGDAENAKSAVAASTQNPPSARFVKKKSPGAKRAKYAVAGKMRPLPSDQFSDKADPGIEKAKATIAAMMENPGSVEFGEITRAVRNLLGESLDAICGYVQGKDASGKDTG